jgi:hypothetical protein
MVRREVVPVIDGGRDLHAAYTEGLRHREREQQAAQAAGEACLAPTAHRGTPRHAMA